MDVRRVALVVVLTAAVVGNAGGSTGRATSSDPATPGIVQCPLDTPGCRVTPHPGRLDPV